MNIGITYKLQKHITHNNKVLLMADSTKDVLSGGLENDFKMNWNTGQKEHERIRSCGIGAEDNLDCEDNVGKDTKELDTQT